MELTWFVGVDWGSQTHQACVSDVAGKLLGERAFEHGGQGLSEMADWLLSFAAGKAEQVGVAIETPRGPVVESLMERGFAVHAINPKQLDRFRDRISPAGAKDDRRDARVLASALRTDPHCLRRLEPTDPVIVELREWSRLSEEMTRERVRQANRMREQLWRYYPQLLAATSDDVAAPWALALWRRLPTPVAAQGVREATLTKFLKQHRIRRVDAATLCDRLRAPAVRVAPGAAEAAAAHVRLIAERLVLVNRQLAHARSQLDRLVHQLAEAAPAEDPAPPGRFTATWRRVGMVARRMMTLVSSTKRITLDITSCVACGLTDVGHAVRLAAAPVRLAAAHGDEQAALLARVGDVPPLELDGFRAPQAAHEEQPDDDAVDGPALGRELCGLPASAFARR